MSKQQRLQDLALRAYWAASTPLEAKMAGILLDLFAPQVSAGEWGPEVPPRHIGVRVTF